MRSKEGPCYLCPDRTMGCHSKCELYIEYSKKLEKEKEEIRKEKKLNRALKELHTKGKFKSCKKPPASLKRGFK